ncbi:prolyl oligopeptidase family serine peptidase [Fontimonas sp. SYSU GA230001]|uniref:prolyl oligopeptidase family serine peptidase n=1 Tax=Fontimonas sp. SYSU GA230001 TaxID=3142450 RepID=UPI0032B35833
MSKILPRRARPSVALLAVGLLAACSGANRPAGGTPDTPFSNRSNCSSQSWIGGTTEICAGVLTYRDYVYDDHGADTSPIYNSPIGLLSPVAGDATYPAGQENTADLVTLELWLDGSTVRVRAELNTLYTADSTRVAVALDTDDDTATGGGDWPGLGIRSSGWDEIHVLDQADPATNRISGSFPRPAGTTWRVQAVVAQADGTVMNVAFRGTQEEAKALVAANTTDGLTGGTWWEDRQAAALAAGDISEFGATVRVDDLVQRRTVLDTIPPGLHQRVYTSAYTLPPGEGISVDGVPGRHGDTGNPCEQYFHFLGKYQPYGLYLPAKDGPHGLQFVMHGCNANHASLINAPGMQRQFGEDLNRILLVPLGRGPVGFNSDIAERDNLDAWQDVLDHYDVDPDQVYAGGYSMGGYGTLRMAALYPDRFAGAVNWVGFTGDIFNTPIPGNPIPPQTGDQGSSVGAIGNVIDFIGNLRHVPTANLYGGEDELVTVTTALALQQAFANADGVVHEFFFHPLAEHLTFAVLDDWAKEAAYSSGRARVHHPARVTYRTDASLDYPEYGITHDRAYWVSAIRGRGAGYIDVDLMSRGCGGSDPTFTSTQDAGVGPAALTWVSTGRTASTGTAIVPANHLGGSLGNVATLTIDTTGTCLTSAPVQYELMVDGPTTLKLSDGRVLNLPGAGAHQGSF